MTARLSRTDDGSVAVLTIGLVAVLLAALLVVASAAHVQLQRSRLSHVADETALAAADALDLDAYYAQGPWAETPPRLDPARLDDEARAHFALSASRHGLANAVLVRASSPDGVTAQVTVALRSPVLFGAAWLPGHVDLTATASARAQLP